MSVSYVITCVLIGVLSFAALTVIKDGLLEKHKDAREAGPAEVLSGCLMLVLCGFAVWHLWMVR